MNDSVVAEEASLELLISELADEFADQLARGEQPRVEDFAARCPEHSGVIRQVLASLELIRDASQSLGTRLAAADAADQAVAQGQLGDFRILREIGRGGMGVVYEAEQISLNRRVALKILPFAAMLDQRSINRFRNEAQSAALLHHQNIVPVYAVGCERGVHFYAMPLIEGQTLARLLAEWRKEHRLKRAAAARNQASRPAIAPLAGEDDTDETENTPGCPTGNLSDALGQGTSVGTSGYYRRIAELAADAAFALDHAHGEGVIHRDIKPSNLILDQGGRIWITDFGLARMGHGATLTRTGDVVGTLRYMSPEQAQGDRAAIDHRSDIYSLGVTLYELLTLRPAFVGDDRQSLLARIAGEEPPSPRKVDARIPAELETIVLKAIAKLPEQRYAAAREMADDLRRYLDDRPILARRPTWLQRLRKWAFRHRALLAAVVVSTILAQGVSVAILLQKNAEVRAQQQQTEQEKVAVEQGKAELEQAWKSEARTAYSRSLAAVNLAYMLGDLDQANEILAVCPVELRGFEWHFLNRLCDPGRLALTWPGNGRAMRLDVSPKGRLVALGPNQGNLRIYRLDSSELVQELRTSSRSLTRLAFSPDERWLCAAGRSPAIQLWDLQTGNAVDGPKLEIKQIVDAAWRPGTSLLAWTDGGSVVRTWDVAAQQEGPTFDNTVGVRHVSVSPDGKLLACSTTLEHKVWEIESGKVLHNFHGITSAKCLSFGPDGQMLLLRDASGMRLVDLSKGKPVHTMRGHVGDLIGATFSPDGRYVASLGEDKSIRLWDASTGQEVRSLRLKKQVTSFVFHPNGQAVVVLDEIGFLRVRHIETSPEALVFRNERGPDRGTSCAGFFSDGRRLAIGHRSGGLSVIDSQTGEVMWDTSAAAGSHTVALAFSPDGRRMAVADVDATLRLFDTRNGTPCGVLQFPVGYPSSVAYSPDGRHLAVGVGKTKAAPRLIVLDAATLTRVWSGLEGTCIRTRLAYQPRGGLIAATDGKAVELLDPTTRRSLRRLGDHPGDIMSLAFSPDGSLLAVGMSNAPVHVWDLKNGGPAKTLVGRKGVATHVAFSPDGERLACALIHPELPGALTVWDVKSLQHVLTIAGHANGLTGVAFSPDGTRLVTSSLDGTARVWEGFPLQVLLSRELPADWR